MAATPVFALTAARQQGDERLIIAAARGGGRYYDDTLLSIVRGSLSVAAGLPRPKALAGPSGGRRAKGVLAKARVRPLATPPIVEPKRMR